MALFVRRVGNCHRKEAARDDGRDRMDQVCHFVEDTQMHDFVPYSPQRDSRIACPCNVNIWHSSSFTKCRNDNVVGATHSI